MACSHPVKIGIIGGSGLNDPDILKEKEERIVETPYGKPSDSIIEGKISGVSCALLARHGRKHNINPSNVNYRANIWALKHVGCTHVIVSTAVGSLKEEIVPGDLVILDSVIDRTQHRIQTFFDGSEVTVYEKGVYHVPMEPLFCSRTRQILIKTAKELGIPVHTSGTAVTIEGPRFSTLAESKLFQSWNCQVVNMTLVPEVFLAKEMGLCYAAVAMATDYDCWRQGVVNVNEVLKTFHSNVEKVIKLFSQVVTNIAEEKWDSTIDGLHELVLKSNMMIK